MTEVEWLDCAVPCEMLNYIRRCNASDRKRRLFACACCRRIWDNIIDDRCRRAVKVSEAFADGLVSAEELYEAHLSVEELLNTETPETEYDESAFDAHSATWTLTGLEGVTTTLDITTNIAGDVAELSDNPRPEESHQADLVRDIFGNPFRLKPEIAPEWLAWRGGTVRRLAQAIYDERAFVRLPILADALEEASCADAAILEHCRGDGPHVRGCWVVDLLLGKE